ncbi:myosin phosphatase Rho-interacting protein [Oryzias latipes]|uniref:myosin phosphatase Rho-interacting protein n=1 Tax=Oryzias latipes TaxID=8090 RepID=UPI0005CC6EB8|nr:myosin phosphatase Rho-interacting protein [Oryzias latipes]
MTTGVLGLTDVPSGSAAHSMRSGRAAERLKVGVFTAKQRAMAGGKTSGSCSRFQANIFNRNKCQNCFKARELHLQNELEMERAKPVYGGWLCLAPEGTDFDNPVQRSRKWQRRFFILFENGGLSFALDELPGTLPQGAVDMLACTDVCDAEPRTGQKNSLCIATPEREVFIRADSREIINGWSEQLCVFVRTNKQNLKKKRKVEPVANQEPSPAKVAATGASFPGSDRDAAHRRGPDPTPAWTKPPGPEWTPAGTSSSFLDPLGADRSPNRPADQQRRRDASSERPDGTRTGQEGGAAVCRQGRTETRPGKREKLPSCGDTAQLRAPPPQRRAKSLDRRTSDTVMTPDLLNFKKGWMVKLEGNGVWRKFWFVLTTDSLRYFKDSLAEETSDLEGEMDLTNVLKVSEYEVQRNYGFQIHTAKAVVTLSAMTAGIRRNWIQALLRNVHPANAPDVASVPALQAPRSHPEVLPKPDVTQDSAAGRAPQPAAKSVAEKRGKGRYKTFDWAEFWPQSRPEGLLGNRPPSFMELGDLERQRRREERRKRYESTLGVSLRREDGEQETRDVSAKLQQEEIEEFWRLVERSALRPDKTVPLGAAEANAAETEKLLRSCMKAECHLKVLEELQCLHQLEVERLLMEGGRLLEEESVATATAIQAIERAHRQELQELQQKSEWERRDPPLGDAYRQHREELASCQRELGVLSQQFSMKCLENRHLIQALDAERKALSQCQQENQHLQSRNQELSGHLAGEITRLCSLAKPESLPPSPETDVYEMEVTLRVKDSEVCYLKREITSLKDKLLSTLKEASYKAAAATFTENY